MAGKKKTKQKQKCTPASIDPLDFYYSTPNSKLLTILIIVSIIIVVVMLFIFKYFTDSVKNNPVQNNVVSGYLSLVGIPVGVTLAFVVTSVWTNYSTAQSQLNDEATEVLALYKLIGNYPVKREVRRIQAEIVEYTEFIINQEFDLMSQGIQSAEAFNMLENIGQSIYSLNPSTPKQTSIYNQAIALYQRILALRISRMGYVSQGIPLELWWVLILGIAIVFFISFFICFECIWIHVIMTALATAAVVSLLFLIIAFDFPYKGDFALSSNGFQLAMQRMG